MNKKLLTILLSVLLPAFLVSAVVYATTSVGDAVSVGTTLTVAGATTLNGNVTLGDAITDTITLNSPIVSSLAYTTAGTPYSFISTISALTGDHSALMARGRATAASAATGEVHGVYARATVNDNLYGGTVTALQTETIAKTGSTVVNLRGVFIAVDSEGTPTAITNMYGAYIRVKTSVAPGTDYYGLVIENEEFGSGVASDAALLIKDTTWSASETSHTAGIVFGTTGKITTGINFSAPVTTGIKFDNAGTQRAIDIQITPTTADRQLYMVIDYAADAKEAAYIIAKSAKTTGEVIAVRGRAEAKAAGTAAGEARGGFFQGIAYDSLYAGSVTGVQTEAIAKTGSTVVNLRGAFFAADSEGTPAAITNMYGTYIRVKTSVAPGTDYYGLVLDNEKFGSGVAPDAALLIKDTTWGAAETAYTAGIVFNTTGKITTGIDIGDKTTTGIDIGSATAGLTFTGTQTNAITTSGTGIKRLGLISTTETSATPGTYDSSFKLTHTNSGALTGGRLSAMSINLEPLAATDAYKVIGGEICTYMASDVVVSGSVHGLFVETQGGGTLSGDFYSLYVYAAPSAVPSGSSAVMRLENNATTDARLNSFIDFVGGKGNYAMTFGPLATQTAWAYTGTPTTAAGWLKIKVGSSDRYIQLYSTAP